MKVWSFILVLSVLQCKEISKKTLEISQPVPTNIENGFIPIFNGENLEGWSGDPKYWSVKDGELLGTVTSQTLLKQNSFIIYKKDKPRDFELKLDYKVSEFGNSGVNYRSTFIEGQPFRLRGYQSDIDGQKRYVGQNYEEKKRTTLAYMGEAVTIPQMPDSIHATNLRANVKKNCWQSRQVTAQLEKKEVLRSHINAKGWNSMHLIIKGNRMQHYVNGILMSDVTDLDTINNSLEGYIGVQVHKGPPMTIAYKNIRLKSL